MYELNKITTDNLTYLENIKNYIETHKKDFKQVFFKPTPNHVKSSRVGVFIKDIYGNEQVTPDSGLFGGYDGSRVRQPGLRFVPWPTG